jgi:uncharacterized membrane protein
MIRERVEAISARLRGSLWFIPSLMTAAAVALAGMTVWLDQRVTAEMPDVWFLFSASAEGAREILSTIAGSIITVTGVVFSITIVALQLASTQYTPRVLRTFTDNRPTQIVLGIFIATFTYSLLVLRAVRSQVDDYDRFLPGISVTIAVLLALGSIGALIFFVNHIAHSIRVETVMDRITTDVLTRVKVLFPEDLGEPAQGDRSPPDPLRGAEGRVAYPVPAQSSGYLQQVDEEALLSLTEEHDLVVRMMIPVGRFVVEGDTIAMAIAANIDTKAAQHVGRAFHIGAERTLFQDVTRGIVELTDIALRALSPSLNDPTTAMGCIDRLTQIMQTLACRRFPSPYRAGEDGRVRVIALRRSFEEMVRLPYGQLRHAGAAQPSVAHRLIESLGRVADNAPAERIPPLLAEIRELLETVRRQVQDTGDLDRLERDAAEVIARMGAEFASTASSNRPDVSDPGVRDKGRQPDSG